MKDTDYHKGYFGEGDRFTYPIESEIDWLVIDTNNLMWRMFHVKINSKGSSNRELSRMDIGLTKRTLFEASFMNAFFGSLMSMANSIRPKKGIIMLYDKGKSWRVNIYPEYKAHRSSEDEPFPDHDITKFQFIDFFDDAMEKFHEAVPRVFRMRFPSIEADDSIGWMVKNNPNDNFHFISNDSDLHQLYKYPNYVQSKNGSDVFHVPNPVRYLEDKVILGDKKTDNIPSIKSGFAVKTLAKHREQNILWDTINNDPEMLANLERNKKLIDLDFLPKDVTDRISQMYSEILNSKAGFDPMSLWEYCVTYRLDSVMRDSMQNFALLMGNLRPPNYQKNILADIPQVPIEEPVAMRDKLVEFQVPLEALAVTQELKTEPVVETPEPVEKRPEKAPKVPRKKGSKAYIDETEFTNTLW